MIKFLLLFGTSWAFYNESCNALDLSKICEDECNTEMNICISLSNGDYDKIHKCLRDHETCFENCPCHLNCMWGCPCGDKWKCPQDCEDIYEEEAGRCKQICDSQVCSCVKQCETYDNKCVQACIDKHKHCLERCPCGPYCPDGCPCDGFCDEQANHTALIISEWGGRDSGEKRQVPYAFKWVVEEYHLPLPNYSTLEHHVGHGSCHVQFRGEFYILGGSGGKYANNDYSDDRVTRVGPCVAYPCGLEYIEDASLPTLTDGVTEYGWSGHSCATVNYDQGDDRVLVCSPYWPANSRNRCWYIKDVKENWEELPSDDILKHGHGNGAMVYVRNRAYMIAGVDVNEETQNPDYGAESGTHKVEFYLPRVGNAEGWAEIADFPRAIKDHAALAYDRWIYVFGGVIHDNAEHIASDHVYSFEVDGNDENDRWHRHRDMAKPRFGFSAVVATPRQILLVGGHDKLADVEGFPEDLPIDSSPMSVEKWTNERPAPLLDENGVFKEPIWTDDQESEFTLDRYMYPAVFMVNNRWIEWEFNFDCDVIPVQPIV